MRGELVGDWPGPGVTAPVHRLPRMPSQASTLGGRWRWRPDSTCPPDTLPGARLGAPVTRNASNATPEPRPLDKFDAERSEEKSHGVSSADTAPQPSGKTGYGAAA